MEWTREKTLSLINEYRKRRGLWDMTHEDYRKKEMKQKLLVEVGASLGGGIPIVEIEKKFHTLRTQYHREINRMKRKEPYNSKWFGFKTLQFLSSPKACRSGKGKIKPEISDDTVTKYILRKPSQDTVPESVSPTNITEEFLTIHRKPTAITFETAANVNPKYDSNRARDLEKLIEETTKDVDEPEELKPKVGNIKEITIPIEHHTYTTTAIATSESHDQQNEHLHTEEHNLEGIEIQPVPEEEITYHHSTSSNGGVVGHHHQQHQFTQATIGNTTISTTSLHPTRIIKIQRRDTCNGDEYYEEDTSHHHQHPQQQQNILHNKRIFYDNGISSATTGAIKPNTSTILTTVSPSNSITKLQPTQPRLQSAYRDEFSTYGEYVANEMRGICNREVMIALKHKINTALFEASMAELQK